MRFADELRAYDPDSEKKRISNADIQKDIDMFIYILRQACEHANRSNKKSVSFYCTNNDGERLSYYYKNKLPTVQDYFEEAKRFNKGDYSDRPYEYRSVGKFERRIYWDLVYFDPDRLDYAKELQRRLNNEISRMGFTSYKVSLVCLDDIYIIYNRTERLFGELKETVSPRVAGKIYTFLFEVSW